jgi:hypothetical protein
MARTATRIRRPVAPVVGQFELMLGMPPAADGQLDLITAVADVLEEPTVSDTTTHVHPDEINRLVDTCRRGQGFFTAYTRERTIVTDARTADDEIAYFVVAAHRWADPYDTTDATRFTRYDVYSIELTGTWAGAVELLMGDYRTQVEAEGIAEQYLAHQRRNVARRASR